MDISLDKRKPQHFLTIFWTYRLGHIHMFIVLIAVEPGSKLDFYIHAVALVLLVMSFEHGWGMLPLSSLIFWLIVLARHSF